MPSSALPVEGGVPVPSPPDGYRNVPVSAPQPDLHIPRLPEGGLSGSGVLAVDFEALAHAIAEAEEAAEAVGHIAERLTSAVQRSGAAPWGDDPALGQTFGSLFAEPRDALTQAVPGLQQVLRSMAENLGAMNTGFHGAQRDAESAIADARGRAEHAWTWGRIVPPW
ncbi:hypothetical protein [Streptomyces violaceorubidus]|uniref:hypothetical protein n=1 Tax=Streptomyces violaceorubidus TaxID=284042 RepID=UPI0012FF0E88|nr:hypothetical protein [Streptomyces violaceorubidus]